MCRSKKVLSMCLVVLLVACSSVWAFPGRTEKMEINPPSPEKDLSVQESRQLSVKPSENGQEKGLTELSTLLESYGKETRLNRSELEDLVYQLENIKADYELLLVDMDEKDIQIADLKTENAAQADELAYLNGAYDAETSTKAYARIGGVLGFENSIPAFGVSGALGLRFGKGLLTEVGAQYMIGTIKDPVVPFSLDNLTITAGIGWEW